MASPLLWSCRLAVALGLLAQGIVLWRAPLLVPALVALAVLVSAALVLHGRRAAMVVAVAAQLGLAVTALAPSLRSSPDDNTWLAREQTRLGAVLEREAAVVADLPVRLERAAAASRADCPGDSVLTAAPFAVVATWRGLQPGVDVVLWRDDQRVGWGPNAVLTPPPPRGGLLDLVEVGGAWVLRQGVDLPAGPWWRAELQVVVANDNGSGLQRDVVPTGRAGPVQWRGDAAHGITGIRDVAIGLRDVSGGQPHLRLSVTTPPRGVTEDRANAGRRFALLVCFAAGALAAGAALAGAAGLVVAAWAVRGLWVAVDAIRLWPVTPPVAPTSVASLADPAYFATTFGGGWLASGADALLSAVLVAATAAIVLRRWPPRPGAGLRGLAGDAVALAFGAAAAVGLLAVRALAHELATNANARLIGLAVPFNSWTFWALHAALLLFSVATAALLVRAAALPGPGRRALRVVLAAAGALVTWLAAAPGSGWLATAAAAAAAILMVLGLAWHTPGRPGRVAWTALGLLLVVTWNDVVLRESYGSAEREWLRRKGEQIVQPQEDWISFLLEDVLVEMAAADAAAPARREAVTTPLASGVWQDALAYELWRDSAVRDLGVPCLIEVLDREGRESSLYARGFLRDLSYEVVERGEWWSLAGSGADSVKQDGVRLQQEVRRYPTGQEQVLRGEIPRGRDAGWLRVELPVMSRRLSTLLAALGAAGDDDADAPGYRPRQEVDRPVLLLRGARDGWLDVGFGGVPAEASSPVIAELAAGRREWGVVELDEASWLCRWAPVPAAIAAAPGEGFLIGLQRPGVVAVLMDWARLVLLDVLLVLLWLVLHALATWSWRWPRGFQGRFLAGYLGIGLVMLVMAGWLVDRLTFERLDRDARDRTRDGLVTTIEQLRGLLAEQGRALAGSDYIAELLVGRLAGGRPQGPYYARQGLVFGPDGTLLLDETLSDLDADEAARLLTTARQSSLFVMEQGTDVYLGTAIPIDLSGAAEGTGTFIYRQRLGDDLLGSLADLVGAELTLRRDGEAIAASHPGRLFAGRAPWLLPPEVMSWLQRQPANPSVFAAGQGGVGLPALARDAAGTLQRRILPAVLTVDFPDRGRDFAEQRRRTALFLAGLATLLLLAAFGLASALTWNIFEPLRVLLGATQRLATGDFAAPLPPPGRDEVGRLAEGFRVMRDELQSARERLESRERFLAAVLERVPVGVVVWDADGRLATLNAAAAGILAGFYPDGEGDAERAERLRRALAARGDPTEVEVTGDAGRRTLRVRVATLALGGEEPHALAVCEDLSEFLATKRLALNAELARQVAHEIKNPLTPIQLSAQLVQQAHRDRHPDFDAIVESAVVRILEQVSLLRSIAGEFSLLGRPGNFECADLDLPSLVADVAAGYGDGPRVAIAAGEVPHVRAHRESLQKVLGNLMQNSLDAAGAPERLRVDVTWHVRPDAVDLVWRDNGAGIPADVAERLFDPYFSTKSKGTGLGLAICRNLLDKMGGRITLKNRDDRLGAQAVLTFLRADAATDEESV
jgi:signal transduction histidine kinase